MMEQSYYKEQFERKDSNRFYVYIHRRLSDNKPFYVGKGCGVRAWNQSSRSNYWKRVVGKHGLKVEIVFDNLEEQDSFQIEKDTILEFQYFGYSLVNHTLGGEGVSGYKFTEEQRSRMSIAKGGTGLSRHLSRATSKRRIKDSCLYKFASLSGESCICTRKSLQKEFGLNHRDTQTIVNGSLSKGWFLLKDDETILQGITRIKNKDSGVNSKTATTDIYTFVHKDTCEVFVGTRMELVKHKGVDRISLSQVFNKNNSAQSAQGWGVLSNSETIEQCTVRLKTCRSKSKSDSTIYEFIHKSGLSFEGTRYELAENFNIDQNQLCSLFGNKKRKTVAGWSLKG